MLSLEVSEAGTADGRRYKKEAARELEFQSATWQFMFTQAREGALRS